MPMMKELVVRAGKYFSVGILFVAFLPVVLPLLFFLSFFGFAFVLPMVCALAGFLYLRKYVGMLFRKLPISILAGCSPWSGRRRSQESAAPTFFINLPLRDMQPIETFEAIDPEFDAVLISTAQREVRRESIEGARDEDISTVLGTNHGADVSADHATRREGLDVDSVVKAATPVGEKDDDDTIVENGTREQGTDDDSSAENETRGTGADDDPSAEIWTNRELIEDDTSADGARKERIDWDTTSEDGTRRHSVVEAKSAENGNREQGTDDGILGEGIVKFTCAEDGKRKQGIDDDTSADDAHGTAGIVDDTPADDGNRKKRRVEVSSTEDRKRTDGIDEALPTEDGIRGEGIDEHISATDGNSKEGIDGALPTEDGIRGEGIDEHISAADGNSREGIDEDTSVENVTRRDIREGDTSVENETKRDGDDDTPVDPETRRWGGDEADQPEEEIGGPAVVEGSELRKVARPKQLSEEEDEEQGDEVEHPNEDKVERSVFVNTERDEGLHSLSSGANYGISGETLEDDNRTPIVSEIEEKGHEPEVGPEQEDNFHSEVVDEEQEDDEKGALEGEAKEQTIESLPRALDEDDQERSSASSAAAAPITLDTSLVASSIKSEGVRDLLPHQADENDIWICKECGWKYPNAKPSAKIRRNHKKHCNGAPSPGTQEMQTETSSQRNESASRSRRDLKTSGPRAGSTATEYQSSCPADAESMQSSPSHVEDDEIDPLHHHNSKRVPFDVDGGSAAVSSANSRGYGEQSCRVESESFRSLDFEFPSTASESFRSAEFEFPSITPDSFPSADDDFSEVRWASFPSAESHYHDEQDQLDRVQVQQELLLSEDLNAVKGVVGDKHVSTGPLLADIEELSEFLGIDLPPRTPDLPEIEWAKLAVEVMKVVVGID